MSEGPLSGDTPTEKAAGNIIRPASTATSKSMMEICKAPVSYTHLDVYKRQWLYRAMTFGYLYQTG